MAKDIKKLAEELVGLTVLEVNELKNVLKTNMASSRLRPLLPLLLAQLLVAKPLLRMKNLNTTLY